MVEFPRFFDAVRDLGSGLRILEELFHDAPFGVYVDHPAKGCVYANPALLEQFGVPWEEFRGFQWARFVSPEDAERIREEIDRYERTLEPLRMTYRVRPPHGEERWVHGRARALVDAEGRHAGTLAIVEDVTDERTLRSRVAGSQKLEAVGRLAARVAHDINNLLTVMLASSDMLAGPCSKQEHGESLATLESAIDQAAQVTRQLLALTRHRMGRSAVSALDRTLRELEPLLSRTLGEGIELCLSLDAGEAVVGIDPGQVGQVVINLLTNASDAMQGYGRIDLRTRVEGTSVVLEVEDHGEGMAPDVAAQVFEPFFTTKEEGRGTGLGLTTVRDLAGVVGGSAHVSSEAGRGTVVRVVFPRVQHEYTAPTRPDATGRGTPRDESVLLVEDKDDLRQSLAYALALQGYRVRSARSLAEAREQVQPPPDVLVTDVMLTDGNGLDLARELRASRPKLAVVVISGFAGESTVGLGEDPRFTAYLPKPFRPRDLLGVLDGLLTGS